MGDKCQGTSLLVPYSRPFNGLQPLRENSFRSLLLAKSEGAAAFRPLNSAQNVEVALATDPFKADFMALTRVLTQTLQALRWSGRADFRPGEREPVAGN